MPRTSTTRARTPTKPNNKEKPERRRKITARALMEIRVPGDPDISPDGRRIAFAISETDWHENAVTSHVYIQRRAGRPDREEPRQLTRGKSNETQPRFSPDAGRWLAFLRSPLDAENSNHDEDEDRHQQVWRLPMDGLGGEAEPWTDAPEGVMAYTWLPDGSGIAYLAREPRPRPLQTRYERQHEDEIDAVVEREEKFRVQIWTIDQEKKPKLVHPGDYGIGELAVSPDGKRIAFSTNYTGESNDYNKVDIWTVEIATGKTKQLTDGTGGKFHPRWSPDGDEVAYLRSLDPNYSYSQLNVFAVPAQGGESRLITGDFPHDISGWPGFEWAKDGSFYLQAAVGATTGLFRLADGEIVELVGADGHVHGFRAGGPEGQLVAYTHSTSEEPAELFLNGQPITALNAKWREQHVTAKTETVCWKSADGLPIEGLLTLPADGEAPFPMIVSIHGGPYGRTVRALTPHTMAQVYAARGYAVLSPNYRGSEGYGDAFGRMNREDLGGGDYEDIMSGVDSMIERDIADSERLAVTGASYGGYMTNWIIGHTNRFKAAVSKFGIFSLITDFSNSESPRWEQEYLGGYYWEHLDRYLAQSPMTYLREINTPVLIVHGESDTNTFISNSREMYTALRLLGRTVEYVHYPREGHGFSEPNHQIDESRRSLAWFDKYVLAHAEPPPRIGDKVTNSAGWELMVTSAEAGVKYAGRPEPPAGTQFLEVVFVIHDAQEKRSKLRLKAGDVRLHICPHPLTSDNGPHPPLPPHRPHPPAPAPNTGRGGEDAIPPLGIPLDALGETMLAEAKSWSFSFAPPKKDKNIRGITIPLALVFLVPTSEDEFTLAIADFPPIRLEPIPAESGPVQEEE